MRPYILAITAGLLLVGANPASAQKVDVGGTVAAMQFIYAAENHAGAGPLVTIHFTPKHALQVTTDVTVRRDPYHLNARVLYFVQYRRTFSPGAGPTKLFLTAGGVGSAQWSRFNAFTYTDLGGHYEQGKWVLNEPRTVDVPSRGHFSIWPPIMPIFGGGIERQVTPRIALRAELTAAVGPYFVLGLRSSGGVIVRLGK